jgi:ribosomal protein S2
MYKRNKDGVHYLDISKTWEKLMVAARVIAAAQIKNPKDVLVSTCLISNQITTTPNCEKARLLDFIDY